MIPKTSREDLITAMELFDQVQRTTQTWSAWENNKAHKFAIKYQDALYPVKQIISMATDLPVSGFSGGDEANNFVQQYNFEIVSLSNDDGEMGDQEPNCSSRFRPNPTAHLVGKPRQKLCQRPERALFMGAVAGEKKPGCSTLGI